MRHNQQYVQNVKETILEKAAEEFSRNGYAGANLQAIADAAGVTRGPLYYYFKNKEELFATVIHNLIEEQREGYEKVLSMDAPIIDILREEYKQCLSYSSTLLQTMTSHKELQESEEYKAFSRWLYIRKKEVFTAAKERGEFRKECDPNDIVTFLYIFYSGVIEMNKRRDQGFDLLSSNLLDKSVDTYIEIMRAKFLS